MCFDSLRTGKSLARRETYADNNLRCFYVSIPSERESPWQKIAVQEKLGGVNVFPFPPNGKGLGKLLLGSMLKNNYTVFPFPPNGKGLGKKHMATDTLTQRFVSIPSERERAWQGEKKNETC